MTTLTAPARFPSFASLLKTRTVLEIKSFMRDKDQLIWTLAFPIAFFIISVTVLGGSQTIVNPNDPSDYTTLATVILPGMLAFGFFSSGFQNLATAIAHEREKGNLKRLRATPLTPVAFFSGKIAQVLVISIVQAALLIGIGTLAFGVALPTDAGTWLNFAWIYLIGIAASTTLGIAFSSLPKTAKSAGNMASGIAMLLAFISGVFMVSSEFPTWLIRIAEVFPLYWMAGGLRATFLPEWLYQTFSFSPDGSPRLLLAATVLGIWFVVGLVGCIKTFRWVPRGK